MTTIAPQMITPAALVDVLAGLYEAEQASIFRFMQPGNTYLTRATVELRDQVEEMSRTTERHAAELGRLIEDLGGVARPSRSGAENQYLAYLSLKFLIPKLANAKRDAIQRYQNALKATKGAGPEEVRALLDAHLADHKNDLDILQRAAALTR